MWDFNSNGYRFIKSVCEEYQVVKKGRKHNGCGEEFTWKKGKGKQNHLPYDIDLFVRISRGAGRGRKFWEENQDLKNKV